MYLIHIDMCRYQVAHLRHCIEWDLHSQLSTRKCLGCVCLSNSWGIWFQPVTPRLPTVGPLQNIMLKFILLWKTKKIPSVQHVSNTCCFANGPLKAPQPWRTKVATRFATAMRPRTGHKANTGHYGVPYMGYHGVPHLGGPKLQVLCGRGIVLRGEDDSNFLSIWKKQQKKLTSFLWFLLFCWLSLCV